MDGLLGLITRLSANLLGSPELLGCHVTPASALRKMPKEFAAYSTLEFVGCGTISLKNEVGRSVSDSVQCPPVSVERKNGALAGSDWAGLTSGQSGELVEPAT